MAKDILIYGEIIPFQGLNYDGYIHLTNIKNQLKEANGEDIRVRINCIGGDVDEGFAIYSELRRYAKEHGAHVTTLAEGRCASIATVFFLAGDTRLVTEYTSPFVHNAWCFTMGDSEQLMRAAVDLEKCNKMIAEHYAKHTDMSYELAREMMDNESYISPQECVDLRFATEIEEVMRPAALQVALNKKAEPKNGKPAKPNNFKTNNKMSKPKATKGALAKLIAFFSVVNKVVFDAENREVDFYELEDDANIAVGDKATIDGKPAGEVIGEPYELKMQSGETYVFGNTEDLEELTEIRPVETEEEEEEMTLEQAQARIAELEAENAQASEALNKAKDQHVQMKAELKDLRQAKANFEKLKGDFKGNDPKNKKGEEQKPDNKFASAIANIKNAKNK